MGIFEPKEQNILSVVDLSTADVFVIQKLEVPPPYMVVLHPDGKHLIVACATGFQVFEIVNGIKPGTLHGSAGNYSRMRPPRDAKPCSVPVLCTCTMPEANTIFDV